MSAIAIDKMVRSRRFSIFAGALVATALGLTSVEAASPAATPNPQQPAAGQVKPRRLWFQLGRASWYGKLFQDNRLPAVKPST